MENIIYKSLVYNIDKLNQLFCIEHNFDVDSYLTLVHSCKPFNWPFTAQLHFTNIHTLNFCLLNLQIKTCGREAKEKPFQSYNLKKSLKKLYSM